MDNPPVMALEEQLSEFHKGPGELSMADSVMEASPLESLTDKNAEDQTLELKNGNIERKFSRRSLSKLNRFAPVQVSKCGPCLVPNRKKFDCDTRTAVTEKEPSEEPSPSDSNSKNVMNGGHHVFDHATLQNNEALIRHLVNTSDNPANSLDISVSKFRSFSGPAFNFDSPPVSPSPLMHPHSAPLPVSKSADLPRIIKHKPSSITFADYDSFLELIQSVQGNESSDTYETSSEDEGPDVVFHGDGDEVFPEMTKEVLASFRRQRAGFDKHRRKGTFGQAGMPPISTSSYEAEEDSSSTEVRAMLFSQFNRPFEIW